MSPKPPSGTTPTLHAAWSPDKSYMMAGQGNPGTLTLRVDGDQPVSLNAGEVLAIKNLPSGWSITPSDADWSWNGSGLTWKGTDAFVVSASPQIVYLTVTPPNSAGQGNTQVGVLLTKSDATAKTTMAYIVFSLVASQPSLAAYAETPALVLLSDPSAVGYPNTIHCALLALAQVPSTQLTLSFHGRDADGGTVDLSGAIKSDALGITVEGHSEIGFTNNGDGTWTATLPALTAPDTLHVKIAGLSISATTLALLEVRCETGQGNASGWFMAFGPYTLSVELDTTNPNEGKYTLRVGDPSTFLAYFLDTTIIQDNEVPVPLLWFTLDAGGQKVFPPVPARFSLNDPSLPPSSGQQWRFARQCYRNQQYRPMRSVRLQFRRCLLPDLRVRELQLRLFHGTKCHLRIQHNVYILTRVQADQRRFFRNDLRWNLLHGMRCI